MNGRKTIFDSVQGTPEALKPVFRLQVILMYCGALLMAKTIKIASRQLFI
jgi:hypothetical protein